MKTVKKSQTEKVRLDQAELIIEIDTGPHYDSLNSYCIMLDMWLKLEKFCLMAMSFMKDQKLNSIPY